MDMWTLLSSCPDIQPMSNVEDKGFKALLHGMDRRYVLPSRTTLRDTLLPSLFDETMGGIKAQLEKTDFVSLTTDMWTSISTTACMAITAHFWDDDDGLCAKIIDCARFEGSHAGEGIAEKLRQTIQDYKLEYEVLALTIVCERSETPWED